MAHVWSGRIAHFFGLEMKNRVWKQVMISGMVIVEMSQDHVAHACVLHTESIQSLHR